MTEAVIKMFQNTNKLANDAGVEEETNKVIEYVIEILRKETDKAILNITYPVCRLNLAQIIDGVCQKQLATITSILSAEKLWRSADGEMYFNEQQQQRIFHAIKSQRFVIYHRHVNTRNVQDLFCMCMTKCKRIKD